MNSDWLLMIPLIGLFGTACAFGSGGERPSPTRAPAFAGRFYEADPTRLRQNVESLLEAAPRVELPGPVVGLMAPHAGYVFSGAVAAAAFKQVQGRDFELVVLLGSAHAAMVRGLALDDSGAYRTPLGTVPVDTAFVRALAAQDPLFHLDRTAHQPDHVLEVELPFLQVALRPGFALVPILFGADASAEAARRRLIELLPGRLAGRRALVVCSTDLAHYPNESDSRRVDTGTLDVIAAFDEGTLQVWLDGQMAAGIPNLVTAACGSTAIKAAMGVSRALGAGQARVLKYANSAESPHGDNRRVVGYGAVAFVGGGSGRAGAGPTSSFADTQPADAAGEPSAHPTQVPADTAPQTGSIPPAARQALLRLARQTIEACVDNRPLPEFQPHMPLLAEPRGVFVTLTEYGDLRGCIGYIRPLKPLWQAVIDNAMSAATRDYRFRPLAPEEVRSVSISISVLSPLKQVAGPGAIEIGRHGIQIARGGRTAVFLPQVATEQGWDLDQTLTALCRKAGLPMSAWREPGMTFQVFTAEVFSEEPSH